MRLSAGRSTFAIITPVAAKIGSSHFKLLGRTALRGTAFNPCPDCEASVHVSCANPRILHTVSVLGSCAYAAGPKLTNRRNVSNVSSRLPLQMALQLANWHTDTNLPAPELKRPSKNNIFR